MSEEELLEITQTAAGHEMENYVYADLNHDASRELIGVYSDDVLDGQSSEYTMGQMAPSFSDWEVTY